MKVVYYARPITMYGRTRDKENIAALKRIFGIVIDPNQPELYAEYKKTGMTVYTNLVKSADVLAFVSFNDGLIPAGVSKEILAAQMNGIPVIELSHLLINRFMTVDETRGRLQEIGRPDETEAN